MAYSRSFSEVYKAAEQCLNDIQLKFNRRTDDSRRVAVQKLQQFLEFSQPIPTDEEIIKRFQDALDTVKAQGKFGWRGMQGSTFVKKIQRFLKEAPFLLEKKPLLQMLPPEMLLHVFSFLGQRDLGRTTQVSHQLKEASQVARQYLTRRLDEINVAELTQLEKSQEKISITIRTLSPENKLRPLDDEVLGKEPILIPADIKKISQLQYFIGKAYLEKGIEVKESQIAKIMHRGKVLTDQSLQEGLKKCLCGNAENQRVTLVIDIQAKQQSKLRPRKR